MELACWEELCEKPSVQARVHERVRDGHGYLDLITIEKDPFRCTAGEGKGADKEKAAVLLARKKRIAEVAGSLKTAAAEHKRQKKAAAAATNAGAQYSSIHSTRVWFCCCSSVLSAA